MTAVTLGPAPAHHREANAPVRSRRPALDGIRALAIVVVMIYHGTDHQPSGGFFSVDVFFVLSGYLIAGLIIGEFRKWGSIDLAAFYVRRGRRLLPGLVLAVIGIAAICPHVLDDQAVSKMRADGLATIFYYANWWFIHQGDSYFAQFGDPSPYRHMWTLAIEEQFYVVLPMLTVLVLVVARRSVTFLFGTFVTLAVLSAAWMAVLYTPDGNPSRVYYGTDARAQDLLLGSALAVLVWWLRRRGGVRAAAATAVGVLAIVVMLAMMVTFDEQMTLTYRGGFTAFVVATCALIAAVELNPQGPVARLLGVSWWAWIGTISYGLYLWHWPVFVCLSAERVGFGGPGLFVLRFAVSFAIGAASYHLVENPIRLHGVRRWVGRTGGIVAGFSALPVAALVMLLLTPSVAALPQAGAKAGDKSTVGTLDPGAAIRVLIVGDSVGFAVGYAFPKQDYPGVSVVGDVIFGCGTTEQHIVVNGVPQADQDNGKCADVFGRWRSDVETYKPNVVLWSLGGWEVFDHKIDGKILKVGGPAYATYLRSRLEKGLKQLGPNVQVVIPNVPCYNQPSYVVDGQDMAKDRNDPRRAAAVNEVLKQFAADHPQVHVADVASHVCPGGKYVDTLNGTQIRQDGVHYTIQGVPYFWRWVMPTIKRAVAQAGSPK